MRFFWDNVIVFHVALEACLFAWIFGGSLGEFLLPIIPWTTLLLAEGLICFPQREVGETTFDARERVWYDMRHDPVFWLSFALVVLLCIPFVNKGLCPICDYPHIVLRANPDPPIGFLPFCVNRIHHLNVVMWFVPALTAMLAVRHALCKRGRRLLVEIIVWNGFALSLLGTIQAATGATGPLWYNDGRPAEAYFFSTFGYPNMGGDYFTSLFALGFACWRYRNEDIDEELQRDDGEAVRVKSRSRFWRRHYLLIPTVTSYFAAINTLSRAAIMLVTALAGIFFLHTVVVQLKKLERVRRFKATVISFAVFVLVIAAALRFMPEDVQREVDTLSTDVVLQRVSGKGQYHNRVALEIWKDHRLFGCGGWGYKHFCISKMTDKELEHMQTIGGCNVHNDFLQFMCEHGIVGLALILAIIFFLLKPVFLMWKDLARSVRFQSRKERPPHPAALFAFPAAAFATLAAVVATVIHSFADCPLRSPAVLTLFFIELTAIDGFLPYAHVRKRRD